MGERRRFLRYEHIPVNICASRFVFVLLPPSSSSAAACTNKPKIRTHSLGPPPIEICSRSVNRKTLDSRVRLSSGVTTTKGSNLNWNGDICSMNAIRKRAFTLAGAGPSASADSLLTVAPCSATTQLFRPNYLFCLPDFPMWAPLASEYIGTTVQEDGTAHVCASSITQLAITYW
jgi:hypothetical protein